MLSRMNGGIGFCRQMVEQIFSSFIAQAERPEKANWRGDLGLCL